MIARNPQAASAESYDLIVVGGGIYGIALALESARRNLRPLLIERGDFGHATSWNSLRIIHGGLRYLQSLNLPRFRESVSERSWYLRHFPDFVRPVPCLLPLYGQGLRRPTVFRCALAANELLSRRRNEGLRDDRQIPKGRVLPVADTIERFVGVDRQGLKGAGLWYDAVMSRPERVLMEMLHWAVSCGAVAVNYVEARSLLTSGKKAVGVEATDIVTGDELQFRAPLVANCAGPWCRDVASKFDRDIPSLFHRSLAFNLLLDREPLADAILAVAARRPPGPTYFLLPWRGLTLAGTYHSGVRDDAPHAAVGEEAVRSFVANLNQAVPDFNLSLANVRRVFCGVLPARKPGTDALDTRPRVHRHGAHGGPDGLFSVSGVKFTTARLVAERTLSRIFAHGPDVLPPPVSGVRPKPMQCMELCELTELAGRDEPAATRYVRRLADEESVVYLDDLLLRRTDWGLQPSEGCDVVQQVSSLWGRHAAEPPPCVPPVIGLTVK